MTDSHKAKTLLFLGGFSAIVLIVLWGAVGELIGNTFPSTRDTEKNTEESTNSAASDLPEDPYVTVVPEEIRAGYPKPIDSDPQRGSLNAPVTIVEFGDFECPDCAEMSPIIKQILDEYPNDVRHVWKDFPLPELHPYSEDAAQAARCAQEQGAFWEYHDALFIQQSEFAQSPWNSIAELFELDTEQFSSCLSSERTEKLVLQGYFIARSLNIDTAPTYYINDYLLTGSQPIEKLREVVKEEIQKANDSSLGI